MRAAGLAMALCLMTSGVSLGAVTIPPDGSGSVQAQTGGSPSRLPALTAEFSTEERSNEYQMRIFGTRRHGLSHGWPLG